MFGISPKVYTGRSVKDVACFISLEQMVQKTDIPYLAECPLETVSRVKLQS